MVVTSTTTAVGVVVGDHNTIITSSIIMMVTITITTAITIPHTDDDDDDDKTQYILMNEVRFLFSVHFFNTVCQNRIIRIHTSRCESIVLQISIIREFVQYRIPVLGVLNTRVLARVYRNQFCDGPPSITWLVRGFDQ